MIDHFHVEIEDFKKIDPFKIIIDCVEIDIFNVKIDSFIRKTKLNFFLDFFKSYNITNHLIDHFRYNYHYNI